MKQILRKFILSGLILGLCSSAIAGRDGGGADVLPKEPVTIESMREVVEDAIAELFPVVYGMYLQDEFTWKTSEKNLIGPSLQKAFENTSIQTLSAEFDAINFDIKEQGPCYEPKSFVPKDAATYFENKYVCISLERLVKKEAGKLEVFATLVHEYTHVYGSDEAEANIVQKKVGSFWLRGYDSDFHRLALDQDNAYKVASNLHIVMVGLRNVYEFKDQKKFEDQKRAKYTQNALEIICPELASLQVGLRRLNLNNVDGFNPIAHSYLGRQLIMRTDFIYDRVCNYQKSFYDKAFSGHKTIKLVDLYLMKWSYDYEVVSNEPPSDYLLLNFDPQIDPKVMINYLPMFSNSETFRKAFIQELDLLIKDVNELANVMGPLFQRLIDKHCRRWKTYGNDDWNCKIPTTFDATTAYRD